MSAQNHKNPFSELGSLADSLRSRGEELNDLLITPTSKWIDTLDVRVDSKPFLWDTHQYLRDMYDDESPVVVTEKAAQMGMSIFCMVRMLNRSIRLSPFNSGYYLPTEAKSNEFSQVRFDKMVNGSPRFSKLRSKDTWRTEVKVLLGSNLHFSYTEGKVSTESTPLDYLVFDEVRRMSAGRIDLVKERLSHSDYKYIDYISTAGYPGSDIDKLYQLSDQHEWWVKCPDCSKFFLPHEEFPRHCHKRMILGDATWGLACPNCDSFPINPQSPGSQWVASYPGRKYRGYHPTQLMSLYISLGEIMEAFYTTDDSAEFWRSKLGIPFLDPNTILVQPEHLLKCIDQHAEWWCKREIEKHGIRRGASELITVLGIDQQQGYNVHVVKAILPSGKFQTIHIEYSYGLDPFRRSGQLMNEYDINICVCDEEPNFNEAQRFARDFPGQVWLANYKRNSGGGEIALWNDSVRRADMPNDKDERHPWDVDVNRVSGMEWSLKRWGRGLNICPPPEGLIQEVRMRDLISYQMVTDEISSSDMVNVPICRELYFPHLQKLAKVRDPMLNESGQEIVGAARFRFDSIGCDPHMAHANLYADIAGARGLRSARKRATAGTIWYANQQRQTEDHSVPMVEILPGMRVVAYDARNLSPTQAECQRCGNVFHHKDTRAEGTARSCLNCMTGVQNKVQPIKASKRDHKLEKRVERYSEYANIAKDEDAVADYE